MLTIYSVEANAPIQKTFACLSESEKIAQWMNGQVETEYKTATDFHDPVGSKFRQNFAGILQLDGEVISYRPPAELGIGIEVVGLRGTIYYILEELAAGRTKVTMKVEFIDATAKAKLLLNTFGALFSKMSRDHLDGIKKLAEQN